MSDKKKVSISIQSAADRAGVPRATVHQWVSSGKIETDAEGKVTSAGFETLCRMGKARDERVEEEGEMVSLRRQLLEAQVGERKAISRLREIELEHESGRFVEVEVVVRDAADARERILGVLRSVPQRVALALECPCRRAAVVERLVAEEVERVVAELAESTYAGGDPR